MYTTSGHLPYYAESMFPPMELQIEGALGIEARENRKRLQAKLQEFSETLERFARNVLGFAGRQFKPVVALEEAKKRVPGTIEHVREIGEKLLEVELIRTMFPETERYYLKAMNCPHHHRVFAAEPHSYRDLPLRLAEYGCCYRYEQSGELFGLMRVRSLNMNDAHIYCTPEQFAAEFDAVNEMYLKYFKIFGLEKYEMRFSTHDPARLGQKFVDEPELWKQTEDMVRQVLIDSKINFVEVP